MFGINKAHISHKLKGDKRLPDESFVDYKLRLRKEKRMRKNYMRGELVWYPGGKRSAQILLYLAMNPSIAKEAGRPTLDLGLAHQIISSGKGTLKGNITGFDPVKNLPIRAEVKTEARREIS